MSGKSFLPHTYCFVQNDAGRVIEGLIQEVSADQMRVAKQDQTRAG